MRYFKRQQENRQNLVAVSDMDLEQRVSSGDLSSPELSADAPQSYRIYNGYLAVPTTPSTRGPSALYAPLLSALKKRANKEGKAAVENFKDCIQALSPPDEKLDPAHVQIVRDSVECYKDQDANEEMPEEIRNFITKIPSEERIVCNVDNDGNCIINSIVLNYLLQFASKSDTELDRCLQKLFGDLYNQNENFDAIQRQLRAYDGAVEFLRRNENEMLKILISSIRAGMVNYMLQNLEKYRGTEFLVEYPPNIPEDKKMDFFENDIKKMATDGTWCTFREMHALAQILGTDILVYYPNQEGELVGDARHPIKADELDIAIEPISILFLGGRDKQNQHQAHTEILLNSRFLKQNNLVQTDDADIELNRWSQASTLLLQWMTFFQSESVILKQQQQIVADLMMGGQHCN